MSIKTATDVWYRLAKKGSVSQCRERFRGRTQQSDRLRSVATFGKLRMVIDEPEGFGGVGEMPNPAEAMLAALGASIEVTGRVYAERLRISLETIAVDLEGDLDIRGFFDTDPSVRSGFTRISADIKVTGNASDSQLRKLLERIKRCCPVLDTLRADVHVTLERGTSK